MARIGNRRGAEGQEQDLARVTRRRYSEFDLRQGPDTREEEMLSGRPANPEGTPEAVQTRKGLTPIELLVVIGLIALLM